MRNYFKVRGVWFACYSAGFYFADICCFDADDDKLMMRSIAMRQAFSVENPGTVYVTFGPFTLWWELDETNFITMLNWTYQGKQIARGIWLNTRLKTPVVSDVGGDIGNLFYAMTKVQAEGSPRKVWSHGH